MPTRYQEHCIHAFQAERTSEFDNFMADWNSPTDWDSIEKLLRSTDNRTIRIDEKELVAYLRSRVKGQDAVLQDLAKFICIRASDANRDKPIASLMFLGPTGTGKTELANALAEYLFKNEKEMIRFEGVEFDTYGSMERLIGSRESYQERNPYLKGELTWPVYSSNPRQVILLNDFEQVHPFISDLFLRLMGEGKVIDHEHRSVEFSQCIIILTSNLHHEEIGEIQKRAADYHEMINAVKGYMAESKDLRPEILDRIDRIYVFQPLSNAG
jgi:ATP-dependent Clp protease ATP-binding subunit ClpA